jgi:peptide/nickel transport system permease protein
MLKRLTGAAAKLAFVLFAVLSLVFFAQRMIPGSPADAVFGADAPETYKQNWLRENGLDRPIFEQYKKYLLSASKGDLGKKLIDGKPVGPQIISRIPATLTLAFSAFSFSVIVAFLSGIFSALHAGSGWDKLLSVLSIVQVSAPVFISGTLLLWFFSVKWDLLPLTGQKGLRSVLLPALTLGAVLSAVSGRMIRSSLLEVLNEDYIRTARAKGLAKRYVYLKHALRNAVLPVIAVLGLQFAGLLGGTVITEYIFTWPGIGSLMIEAVNQRDYNLVSACVVVLATIHVLVATLADLFQQSADPRIAAE